MKKDNKEDINLNNELGYINGKEILNFFGVSSETIKTWRL